MGLQRWATVVTSDMEALRARIAEVSSEKALRRGRRVVFVEPQVADFASGSVLSLDQTLTKTGWTYLHHRDALRISSGGVIRPDDGGLKGFEQTFARERALDQALRVLFEQIESQVFNGVPRAEAVVHEMPAVVGHRLESSLMAAAAVRRQAARFGYPVVMISRTTAYARLVGSSWIEKRHGTAAVNRLIPKEQRSTTSWNQDVHDAGLLGLAYLYEKKRVDEQRG